MMYTALPPLFLGGCDSGPAVEVGMWAAPYFGDERLVLRRKMNAATEILADAGVEGYLLATSAAAAW
jgi:hypothetical protein